MKRLISAERIAALLMPHGFALAADWGASDIVYSRPSELPELWEQISVGIGGKQGEAVGAGVSVDVRYGGFLGGRGLFEARGVPETGNGGGAPPLPPPSFRRLHDREDALLWE